MERVDVGKTVKVRDAGQIDARRRNEDDKLISYEQFLDLSQYHGWRVLWSPNIQYGAFAKSCVTKLELCSQMSALTLLLQQSCSFL